jgi:hypothetical protein
MDNHDEEDEDGMNHFSELMGKTRHLLWPVIQAMTMLRTQTPTGSEETGTALRAGLNAYGPASIATRLISLLEDSGLGDWARGGWAR